MRTPVDKLPEKKKKKISHHLRSLSPPPSPMTSLVGWGWGAGGGRGVGKASDYSLHSNSSSHSKNIKQNLYMFGDFVSSPLFLFPFPTVNCLVFRKVLSHMTFTGTHLTASICLNALWYAWLFQTSAWLPPDTVWRGLSPRAGENISFSLIVWTRLPYTAPMLPRSPEEASPRAGWVRSYKQSSKLPRRDHFQ